MHCGQNARIPAVLRKDGDHVTDSDSVPRRYPRYREQEAAQVREAARARLRPFGVLDLASVRAQHDTDNFVQVTINLPAHDLADILEDIAAVRDEWQDLAGEWEARARRALEGVKGSNNLMHTWRERALSAEDKLRVLTTPRDVWTEDQG